MSTTRLAACIAAFAITLFAIGFAVSRPDGTEDSPVAGADAPQVAATVGWADLRQYNYRSGIIGETLLPLIGKTVRIAGFMVPLEDEMKNASEFLLVPYLGGCIHTPPPPPNQIVRVAMIRNRSVTVDMWNPVWVTGQFEIAKTLTQYGDVSFQLIGQQVKPYDPQAP